MSAVWLRRLVILLLVVCAPNARARLDPEQVRNLQQVLRAAGYVFTGRVVSVKCLPARMAGEVATVLVTFHVEKGLRGTRNDSTFTIRQWAGLWSSGERYRVGERLLVFIYPRSRLGLTSAVGGARGRLRVDGKGDIVLPPANNQVDQRPGRRRADRIPLSEFTRAMRRAQNQEP